MSPTRGWTPRRTDWPLSVICKVTRTRAVEANIKKLRRCNIKNTKLRLTLKIRAFKEDTAGGRRRLHNEELHILYDSPNFIRAIKSRRVRWVGHVTHMGEEKILVGKPERKRLLGRPSRRWEDNIIMDHTEIGWEAVIGCIWIRIGTSGKL
jgi:hypothetical protein